MPNQTVIILILVGVALMFFLYWRSKREERSALDKTKKMRVSTQDVLTETPRIEPGLGGSDDAFESTEARAADDNDVVASAPEEPSEEPPIYEELEREEAEEKKAQEEARAQEAARPVESELSAYPPVDPGIEWVLDISPRDGLQFSLGGVKSLELELKRLDLPLLVRIWAQSSRDGLYYDPKNLSAPARHVVAAMVLANRTAKLDPVMASNFYQVLEQSAAQNDVAVRRQLEPVQAAELSDNLKSVIEYYDRTMEVSIVPTDPNAAPFGFDTVNDAARAAGFTAASGRWEYRPDPTDHDPVITLAFGSEGGMSLCLGFDVPLSNLSRGDLKLFFTFANHFANTLHAAWTDRKGHPIDAAGAVIIEENIRSHVELMASKGVPSGSNRAKLLFARGA